MYVRIEKDIENKECKEIFENECEQGMKELDRTIEGRIKKCEEQFSKDIKEDIGQFEERIKDSLVMLNRINIDSVSDPIFFGFRNIQLLESCRLGIHRIRSNWDS
ncbi:hypothetical protein V5H57_03270 [Helicobacter pylori]